MFQFKPETKEPTMSAKEQFGAKEQFSLKEQFIGAWEREFPTTLKVLKAFPASQLDFKPHERSMPAKQLAWLFVQGQICVKQTLDGTLTMPPKLPSAPAKWEEIVATYEKSHAGLVEKLGKASEADFLSTMKLMVGPGKMADVPKVQWFWFLLSDAIHHRGQFSVYLRMAGGKVPSIYGPSADEPWM